VTAARRPVWLVCLLAISLVLLATKAKLAQYGTGFSHTPQITKATKLAEGRLMKDAVAVACPKSGVPVPGVMESSLAQRTLPDAPPRAPVWQAVYLRPPPIHTARLS